MAKYLLISILLVVASVAQARNPKTGAGMMRPLCEQFAAKKRVFPNGTQKKPWIDVDTIRWNERFVPEFQEIVRLAKDEAVKNGTFKAGFVNTPTRSYTQAEIDQRNQVRLQSECGSSTDQLFNCTHFRADCAMQMSNNVLTDALKSFSECATASIDNRYDYKDTTCGTSFRTPQGVRGNIDALDKAVKEIEKLKLEIEQNPGLSEYFSDVEKAYAELHDLYEKALSAKAAADINFANLMNDATAMDKFASGVLSDFDSKANKKFNELAASDAGFKKAVDVLNKCDDYLDKKGYQDKHSVISQINICQIDVAPATQDEIKNFTSIMDHLEEQNDKQNLKNVAVKALENSVALTVTEFANLHKAMTGKAPTHAELCAKLDATFCQNPIAKSTLNSLGDLPNVPKMNMQNEIESYNKSARDMHKLCKDAAKAVDKRDIEAKVQQQLTKIMYQTRVGQLMGFKKFRDAIGGPFDSEACLKGEPGFAIIPENQQGIKLFSDATWKIAELQKDKSKQIKDYQNQVGYHGKYLDANDGNYEKLLRNLLENDPFTVREAIRASGNPDQALWLCHATADIYRREKSENTWKWIGTGLCIAGSLAATVFTFGAATPLLVGSIAMGAGIGVYNLNQAWTKQHNTAMSAAVNSSDPIINTYAMMAADEGEKAAYVEIGLSMLPAFMKGAQLGGKALAPLISKTPMVANALQGGAQAYGKLGASGKAIVDAMKKGQKITTEMLQKGLGEKFANAGGKGMIMVGDFLRGAAPDAAMELMVAVAIHPDPLSEDAIRSMILGVGMGSSMRLGAKGMQMMRTKYKGNFDAAKNQINNLPTSPEVNVPVRSNTKVNDNVVVDNSPNGSSTGLVLTNNKRTTATDANTNTNQNFYVNKQTNVISQPNVNVSTNKTNVDVTSPTNKTRTVASGQTGNTDPPTTHKISRDGMKPSEFKKYLESLNAKKGDVLEIPGPNGTTQKFTVEKRLGGEAYTEVYLLADGNVLRVNKRSLDGFGSVNSFRKGYQDLKNKGVPVAEILPGEVSADFVIVKKIDSGVPDRGPVSYEDFYKNKDILPGDRKKYEAEFEEFVKKTKGFETLEDFRPDQILYDKDRGWVLADYGVDNRAFDGSGKMTAFDDQMWSDLDPKDIQRFKDIVNHERTLVVSSAVTQPKPIPRNLGKKEETKILQERASAEGIQLSEKKLDALYRAHDYPPKGTPGAKPGTEAGIGNYTPEQKFRKGKILMDAGFTRQEAQLLMDKGIAGNFTFSSNLKVKADYDALKAKYKSDPDIKAAVQAEYLELLHLRRENLMNRKVKEEIEARMSALENVAYADLKDMGVKFREGNTAKAKAEAAEYEVERVAREKKDLAEKQRPEDERIAKNKLAEEQGIEKRKADFNKDYTYKSLNGGSSFDDKLKLLTENDYKLKHGEQTQFISDYQAALLTEKSSIAQMRMRENFVKLMASAQPNSAVNNQQTLDAFVDAMEKGVIPPKEVKAAIDNVFGDDLSNLVLTVDQRQSLSVRASNGNQAAVQLLNSRAKMPQWTKMPVSDDYTNPNKFAGQMKQNPKYKEFGEAIEKWRTKHTPKTHAKQEKYKLEKQTTPDLLDPMFGYKRMKMDGHKWQGLKMSDMTKLMKTDDFVISEGGGKVFITPRGKKVDKKEYIEALYDPSGGYVRFQKGTFDATTGKMKYPPDDMKYVDIDGNHVTIPDGKIDWQKMDDGMSKTHFHLSP